MYAMYCKLRDMKGVRDAQVSKETGIPRSTFSDWKNGRSVPKQAKLQKIADYFNVPITVFTGMDADLGTPLEWEGAINDQKSPFDYFPEGYAGFVDGDGVVSITYPDGKRIDTSMVELDRIIQESEAFIRFKLELLKSEQQKT